MKLLKVALFFVLVATISAKPVPPDADIPDKDQSRESTGSETSSSTSSKDSKESSESDSSEESNSSEEDNRGNLTSPPRVVLTTVAMTTITSGDGSTVAPEPVTTGTNGPTATVVDTTVEPGTVPDVTTPCNTTLCFTEKVPTPGPVTQVRGDM